MSITRRDREKLRQATEAESHHELGVTVDPDDGAPLRTPWRLNDGRSGVTLEQCNAVRCAAADGLTYTEISELFGFLGCKTHAHKHATGQCRHEHGVPPTTNGHLPGPEAGSVSPAECADLRRRWRRGHFDTYREAARWFGRAESAAWRHINGECSHHNDDPDG